MKVLTFLSQKGGSGKTTLVVHAAVAAHEAGHRVVVIDTDPQKSAAGWSEAREAEEPQVIPVAPLELAEVLKAARADKMDFTIIDTAPHAAPEAARIARASDFVAIPVRPTAFDLAAAGSAAAIVKAAKVKAGFVLSACPFRAPEIADTRAVLAEYGLPVAPAEITDRRAFSRAIATGRAVTEFESDGKAAEEIRALWAWLKEQAR
ncbi:ParA family partition ATPase [Acidisoma sp. S159]|uniref:ParA family partition ATPase n=1 Tax=Acidisoma sp. S159 TaxID=1747225 RepID=UPI00131CA8F5|nr:ParA family partition ATPase [Acidisoma sp. S159]